MININSKPPWINQSHSIVQLFEAPYHPESIFASKGRCCGFATIDGIVLSPQSPVVSSGHVDEQRWRKSHYIPRGDLAYNDIHPSFSLASADHLHGAIEQATCLE